jgi:membrane protease YdiL (CAAX protease family)
LFALVHILGYIGFYPFEMLLLCFVQYLPAGICLAAAYRLSGSLLSPILIHALVNLLAMLSLR